MVLGRFRNSGFTGLGLQAGASVEETHDEYAMKEDDVSMHHSVCVYLAGVYQSSGVRRTRHRRWTVGSCRFRSGAAYVTSRMQDCSRWRRDKNRWKFEKRRFTIPALVLTRLLDSNLKSLKEAEHHKSAAARKKFLVFSFTCLQLLLVIIILVIAVSTSRMQATYITPILLIITLLSHPECTATGPDRKQRKSQFLPLSEADLPSGTYRAITGSNDRICDTLPDLTRFDMIVEGSSEGQTAQLNASCCGSPVSMDTGHPLGRYEQARELFRIGPKLFLQQECFRFVKSQIESGLDEFQIRFAALFGLRRSSNPLSDLVMCKDGLEDEITVCYKPTRGGYKLSLTACTHHFTLAKDTSTPEGFEAPSSVEASEETKQRRKRKTNNPTTTEPKQQKMIIVDSEYAAAVPSSGAITDGSYVVEEADFTAQVIIVTDADRKQRHGAFQIFGEKDILVPALEWVKDGRGCLQSWPLSLEEPLPILKKRFGRVAFSVSPDSIVICPKDVNKLELTLSDEDAGLNHSFILTKQPQ